MVVNNGPLQHVMTPVLWQSLQRLESTGMHGPILLLLHCILALWPVILMDYFVFCITAVVVNMLLQHKNVVNKFIFHLTPQKATPFCSINNAVMRNGG